MMRYRGLLLAAVCLIVAGCTKTLKAGPDASDARKPTSVAEGRGKTVVAVLPFANNTGKPELDGLGGTLAEAASLELVSRGDLVVVERQRIADLLAELKLDRALIDPDSAVRIGRLLGARFMIFGSLSALGGARMITERVVSVETGQIIAGSSERFNRLEDSDGVARAAAKEAWAAALASAPADSGPEAASAQALGGDAVDDDIPRARSERDDAIGVVIGVRDYKNRDVPKAEYAVRDATTVKRYLERALGYRHVIYLEDPTKAELEALFGTAHNPRGQLYHRVAAMGAGHTPVFVYYSGHGAPGLRDGHPYLVPSDADPDYVELNGYPRDVLLDNLAGLGVPVTVVLETCFSGSYDQGSFIKNASPLFSIRERTNAPKGVDLFTSSSASEVSSWYPEKSHSLFTYFFLKELRSDLMKGEAPKYGQLSASVTADVESYAAERFKREQTPEFFGSPEHAFRF